MKTLRNKIWYILIIAFAMTFSSCQEFDDLVTDGAPSGGLVEPQAVLVNYLVGDVNADYTVTVLVPQGDTKTTAIEIWATFSNALGTGESGLVATAEVTHTVNSEFVSASFSYQDLRAATRQADGSELPADDLDLVIGDKWTLKYRAITSAGNFTNAASTSLAVSTRYAGTYDLIDMDYWRVGSDENQFDGLWLPQFTIESLDVANYRMTGVALWSDQEVFFDLTPELDVTYPENEPGGDAQSLNGQPLTTCTLNPGDLANVPCDVGNVVTNDDVAGEDIVNLVFGYFTAGSGPREFYHLLRKVVD